MSAPTLYFFCFIHYKKMSFITLRVSRVFLCYSSTGAALYIEHSCVPGTGDGTVHGSASQGCHTPGAQVCRCWVGAIPGLPGPCSAAASYTEREVEEGTHSTAEQGRAVPKRTIHRNGILA